MAQTLISLLVHVVFSTKNRVNLITPEIEPDLYAYLGGIARKKESRLLAAGGAADHVHLLISQSKNIALSPLVAELKKSSSAWIKTKRSSRRLGTLVSASAVRTVELGLRQRTSRGYATPTLVGLQSSA